MVRRPHYMAWGMVTLLALVLLRLPSPAAARIEAVVGSLFVPLFGASSSARGAGDKAALAILPKSEIIRQNQQLRVENERFRLRAMQADELLQENARLRAQIDWQRQAPWNVKHARVIGRDPANWWRTIHIDAGSRDGVRPNLPVLTSSGLAGRVATVSEHQAHVILLGDPNLRVGAVVQRSREGGVIVASGRDPMDYNSVHLTYLGGDTDVQPGDTVVTRGDGGVFPGGIVIGTIIEVRPVDFGLASEARVRLAANLRTTEEVWVILP